MTYGRVRRRAVPQPLPDSPLESAIQGEIWTALERIGCKVSSTSQYRPSRQALGMPDLFVVHVAWKVHTWLEVKRPGEKPTKVQEAWHAASREAGCPVYVVHSAEEALRAIDELHRRRA